MFALVAEEIGEACILSQIIKIIMNPGCSQELITRPFTRLNLRGARKIIFGFLSSSLCLSFELRLGEPLNNLFIIFFL